MAHRSDSDGLKYSYDVLGTLLEAAIRDQKLTGEAVKAMTRVSGLLSEQGRQLPETVAAAVNTDLREAIDTAAQILTSRVEDANVEAIRAAEAFRRATNRATVFVFIPALLVTAALMAIWYGVTAHLVHGLEQEKLSLQQKVDYLYSHGGNLDVRRCPIGNGETAPCIRVEKRDQSGYHVPIWVR